MIKIKTQVIFMNKKILHKIWRLQQLTHLIAITRLFAGVQNKAVFTGILSLIKNIENKIRVFIENIRGCPR